MVKWMARAAGSAAGSLTALWPLLAALPAAAADPKVPPAIDTGNRTPIAILTVGFDYTHPAIAARLARDGEGEIIGWDLIGEDRLPFDAKGDTALIQDLVTKLPPEAPVSLLPVRVDPANPVSLGRALAFVDRTPARIVLVPMWSPRRETWAVFAQAAAHYEQLQIVVRECAELPSGGPSPVFPRDLKLPGASLDTGVATSHAAAMIAYVRNLSCSP